MRPAKIIADGITWTRVGIGVSLIGLGWRYGEAALAAAAWLMLADWVGDVLDGAAARMGGRSRPTWIGEHDLEVDIFVSLGLSVYLWRAGFVHTPFLVTYLVIWLLIFLVFGFRRALGMLFQAPVYGLLILKTLQFAPFTGRAILFGLLALIILTWPRLPEQVIPGFLGGIRDSLDDFGKRRGV